MKDMTLLVMAAGMGSRYGGLKQLDAVGPNGETIIDFSVYDAIRAGYNKVVFIIRKDFEKQFKQKISNKYKNKIEVEIVYQDLNDLIAAVKESNFQINFFDTSCFDGKYITEGVTPEYLENLHSFRKSNKSSDS